MLRVTHAHVNWYLLDGDDGVTVVDAGLPRHWSLLPRALQRLGRRLDDVRAVVLTHSRRRATPPATSRSTCPTVTP